MKPIWSPRLDAAQRLNRLVAHAAEHRRTSATLERIARETGGNLAAERHRLHANTPADTITLRGIPAVGHGIAGVIRGTQPEAWIAQ